ncbi:MAG TPA: Spy/CpxP family protein refolding chaperone [Candidatus Acidoferrum sp.]|nr:Spy/CpxP family protein refolding chaperone [Candidatus Acidoferrum sp.]
MNFSTKTIGAVGTILVAVCVYTPPSYAQSHPKPHEPLGGVTGDGTGMALPLLLRGAKLTPEQKAQVQQIMANHRGRFRDLFSKLRATQDQMANKLFSAERLQEADLAPQVQEISQLRNQLAEQGLRVVLEIRGVLTPEQLAKASQLKSQMQSLHSQMLSLWGPDRPDR